MGERQPWKSGAALAGASRVKALVSFIADVLN